MSIRMVRNQIKCTLRDTTTPTKKLKESGYQAGALNKKKESTKPHSIPFLIASKKAFMAAFDMQYPASPGRPRSPLALDITMM
jgi:hypothetical protein